MKAKQTQNINNLNNNNNIGLEEKNSIIQAWINLKDSIFNVLFVLLDKNQDQPQESLWGLAFQSGLDYLQMMAFPFDQAIIDVWNGGQTLQNVISLFDKLNISSYLPGVSFGTFLVLLYSLIFLIILVMLDIIYVSYSFSKKKFRFTWPLVLLAQIVPLFVTVFFLPMTQTLLSIVLCQGSSQGNYQVMISFPEIKCWQGWHLFHAAVTLLFVSIFVFISSVVALALFEPRMTTNKLTARQNSTAQVVFIMNKIVCQFIFSFTPFDDSWIYCVMLFGFSFWQFWCYNVNQPYYSKKATKFFKVVSTYYLWTTLMLMVSQILKMYHFNGGLVIWLGGLPFLFTIILFQRKSNIGKLFSNNLKFRNGQYLQNHITYVLQLIQNQKKDKNSYMLLIGYIQKHKQICTEQDCPFNKYLKKKKKYGENQMQDNCIMLLKQLERMYKTGIKKYPQSTKLRLSFAFFHLQRTKNKNKAYEQFSKAQQTDPSFEQQFIIYRFKKIIRENLQDDDNGGSSDLIQMIRFDNHISLCEQAMLMSARLHKQFWAELKQQIPNLKKLNDIGSKITQTGNGVKENYLQISKINSSVPQILYNYAVYLLLITEDYNQGRQLLANAKKLYQDKLIGDQNFNQTGTIDFQNSINDRTLTPILIISRNQQKLGKILNCNLMVTQISGYYKEQLCDRDFHKLLPQTYVSAHQFTLNDWSKRQNSNSQYLTGSHEGFIKQKSGCIVAVNYTIKYNIVQEQFIVQFKLDVSRTIKCIVLSDSKGMIKQYSLMARNFLHFKSQPNTNRNQNTLYLQQIGIDNYQGQDYIDGLKKVIIVQQKQKQCLVKIRGIMMKHGQEERDEDTYYLDQITQKQKQTIGFIVQISPIINYGITQKKIITSKAILKSNKKIKQKGLNSINLDHSQIKLNQDQDQSNNQIDDQILNLYNKPMGSQVYIKSLKQINKQNQVILHKFQLTQKIKTMRLLDNQIKMVYNKNSDSDYNGGRQGLENQDDMEVFKFDDQNYQTKLRKAINTNINHIEITQLKCISFIFIIILFVLVALQLIFSIQNMDKIIYYSQNISKKAVQIQYLSKYITGSIKPLPDYDNKKYYNQMNSYNITYQTSIQSNFKIENSIHLEKKNLKDIVIFMHSKLLQYFSQSQVLTISNVYYNFVNYIYDAFQANVLDVQIQRLIPSVLFGSVIFVTLCMILYWIYISLQLDKKKYDIMIWFLDIPIPYVAHLSTHCDKYLKQFIGIKQLMQKSMNLDQIDQNQYQQFNQNNQQNKQDQIQQQIKARKSLIAKHRKQTLFNKLNISYFSMIWLLIYASLIAVLTLVSSQLLYTKFQLLYTHWRITARNVYWQSGLDVALMLAENSQIVGNVNVTNMALSIQNQHLNYINHYDIIKFNKDALDYTPQLAHTFRIVYFQSLCQQSTTNVTDFNECLAMLDGKLSVGFNVYSKYLVNAPKSQRDQIRIANQKYVIPSLVKVLITWQDTMKQNVSSTVSLCSIMLYVYIILTVLSFLIFWLMYLKRMNTQLNQTIQMLNMIPFKLLPKSRKQTKQFITWIIKQASKKKHQSD